MNAEALLGTVLGTCTLQRLIGQGGMGAVYLAQQSRPRRQVAVKVLMPLASLTPVQLAAFLERFRRETDAAASLEHPNIMPVHEYGERENLAYLVMPYVSGGTLRDEMENEGQLPLTQAVKYLEQLAAALDFAHERGVIHRDIKPANILMTPEGRLLLTDFGLVKIIAEGQMPQVRLTGEGAPVGTPDYMAPEQVIGEEVDGRSDLYSLGVILYQMVTGTTPFQGETPMQIAAQQLQVLPPSPRQFRPDLPVQVERVILRGMAKRPDDRYPTGRAFTKAFLAALDETGIPLDTGARAALNGATAARLLVPKGSFEVAKPTGMLPSVKPGRAGSGLLSGQTNMLPSLTTTTGLPAAKVEPRAGGGGLLSKTGKFPQMNGTHLLSGRVSPVFDGQAQAATGSTAMMPALPKAGTITLNAPSTGNLPSPSSEQADASRNTTGSMAIAGKRNTVKLTSSLKLVQMEVAGQPGQYVTGFLPTLPATPSEPLAPTPRPANKRVQMIGTMLALVVLLFGTIGTVWFVRSHSATLPAHTGYSKSQTGMPNPQATAYAQATAAARANIILDDPLSVNTNNWLTSPADVYAFKDGAYHITDRGDKGRATILQSNPFGSPLGYTVTMEEINGDDTSVNNSFGMIMRFTQQNKGGKMLTTFYSFEVVNNKGGEYQFWKYDDSTATGSPWTEIWHQPFGNEFHEGHGAQSVNTFKVFMNGATFTVTVNGKQVKTLQDKSLQNGTVGMLVNLNGTEVAFKNLLLTRN
jgi:serine/threonine protein kinase